MFWKTKIISRDLWSLKKFKSAYFFQIAQEKACDYLLIIYIWRNTWQLIIIMQKQSARIKCKNDFFTASYIARSVKTTANDKNNNIQRYFHIFKAQKSSKSGWTVEGIVRSGLLLLCTELTLFCIELPNNFIHLNQSEQSNISMYLISSKTSLFYLIPRYFLCLSSKFWRKNLDFSGP